jgi:transcriptional regulator with XRE-family HTH domain
MNDNTETSVSTGIRVRQARKYRGITLETLAGRIGRSKAWLSMIENGRLPLDKRQDIAAIAEVLEVSADTLLGQPAPEIRPGVRTWSAAPFRTVLLDAAIDDPPDIAARPLPVLGQLVESVDQALRRADYDVMHRDLPGLLGELQVHAAGPEGCDRDEALRLLIAAAASATIMLKHWGRTDLAWISADRGRQAAVLLGDPVHAGAAAFGCAHASNSANRPRALMATPAVADRVGDVMGDDMFAREVYGMLRLSAALACAVVGDHSGAADHAEEAARIAAPLGDRPEAFEVFGAANVGVWRASLAAEAGNAGQALTFADAVESRALASDNRRAALSMEKARALVMEGKSGKAVAELRHAERLSPAQVHNHPMTRDLVAVMLDEAQRKAGVTELRGLAWRMGVVKTRGH